MESLTQFKHLIRRLVRSPMFAVVTLLTLAVGIGANTAIFSVVNGVLLKPLPYRNPEALVAVWQTAPRIGIKNLTTSAALYFVYREETHVFEDIGLWSQRSVSITGISEPEQVDAIGVTDGTLPLLGVTPFRGRWFSRRDDEPRTPPTVVLSYAYWQRRFGGDPSAIGKTLMVDGRSREVIGIMPESFHFLNRRPALFIPFQFDRAELHAGGFGFVALARLKPGVTIAQANADAGRVLPILSQKFKMPQGMTVKMFDDAQIGPDIRPLARDVVGDVGDTLWVLMATVGIVLAIACANVANLLLVRAEGRQRELAVRAALGASWSRIARELLFETVTLGALGGALGVGVAYGGLRLLKFFAPTGLPRLDEITIDPRVLFFAAAISLLSGFFFGLAPVFKYAGPRLDLALRGGSRTFSDGRERHRTQRTLVVVQVALALVLLAGSGLMIRTFQALRSVEPGFSRPEEILTLRVSIPSGQIQEAERVGRMYHEMLQKIAAIPGVISAGLSNSITMDGTDNNDPIFVEDRPVADGKLPPVRRYKHVSPGLLGTMGNPILAGRDITWTDVFDVRPVVLISENLAREYWRDPAEALGKRVRENPKGTWREIIGVVGNERDNGVDKKAPTIVYWPVMTGGLWGDKISVRRNVAFAIRSNRTGTESFIKDVRQAVWSVNSNLPIANVRTVAEIYQRSMARTSFTLVMLAIAASMALLLGLVGIYGVICYSISQRTREIGIRIALGASRQKVQGIFMRQGIVFAVIGVACGLAAAVPLTRLMSALLFEVSPLDPATYCAVSAVLVGAALLAAYLPARQATRIEPVEALRAE
jgi:putative ABC transport system permease protein